MKAWWREKPLHPAEVKLLEAVSAAHDASARRQNASSHAALLGAAGSGNYAQALIAALATLGGLHAPLEATCHLLAHPQPAVRARALLESGLKVPGWGNSFHRGDVDPLWTDADGLLRQYAPAVYGKLYAVTETLRAAGKNLFPNPSAYTAATALHLGLPPECAAYLFVAGRLDAWSGLIRDQLSSSHSNQIPTSH